MAYFLRNIIIGLLFLVLFFSKIEARNFHVTTDGTFNGTGSIYSPRSLQRAFEDHANYVDAGPGDTILIHGGDYYGNYTCWVSGKENNPLVIKPYNNDVVRLIGTEVGDSERTLNLNGSWCIVRNLIITHTARARSFPEEVNADGGVALIGDGIKFINNIIHDVYGTGILGSGSNGDNAEASGNIIFNIGWIGSKMTYGHGLYLQSNEGAKKATNNIVFNTYGHGIHFFTTGGQRLDGLDVEKNIVFNAGAPAQENGLGAMRNMILGGNASVDNLTVRNNYTYHPDNANGTGIQIGYNSVSEACRIEGNYIAGGNKVFVIHRFKSAVIQNNTIIGRGNELLTTIIFPEDESVRGDYDWNLNSYYAGEELFFYGNNNKVLDFENWQNHLGFDRSSRIMDVSGLRNHIDVIPNQYEEGRAHLVIYNWEEKDSVSVDLSGVLEKNDHYIIYDVENIFEPLMEGEYNGKSVEIPLRLSKVIQPTGDGVFPVFHTNIDFGCFLLVSDGKKKKVLSKENREKIAINRVYPNPTRDFVIIEYLLPENRNVKASIYDLKGHLMVQKEEWGTSGNNKFLINLAELDQKTYLLFLEDGFSSDSCNIIVNR